METNSLEDKREKKIDISITTNVRDRKSINEAIKIQDNLSNKSGSWSGENEIRKWRENH